MSQICLGTLVYFKSEAMGFVQSFENGFETSSLKTKIPECVKIAGLGVVFDKFHIITDQGVISVHEVRVLTPEGVFWVSATELVHENPHYYVL